MDDLFIDIYQGKQIASAQAEASKANDRIGQLKDDISFQNKKLQRMALINAAMWDLSKEKLGFIDEDLKAKILEIDAMDGVIDGKASSLKRLCDRCQKSLHPKHDKCLYCGHDNKSSNVFHV